MFAFVLCLFAFLATASLAQPAERETSEAQRTSEKPFCRHVRFVTSATQREDPSTPPPKEEVLGGENPDPLLIIRRGTITLADHSTTVADRKFFESSLVNWQFFEDLAPKQQAIVQNVLARCEATETRPSPAASFFGQWNASQRSTFVGITHALMNTLLIDSRDGTELGDALELIQELVDIQGENDTLPSDQQFQLIVQLTPNARQKLAHAAHFEKGENHVFHKDYPLSFRQIRQIGVRGQEAGLHLCVTRDGRFAQIHIDYRFGLLHLGSANSDLRADGNHQRHADRWPQFAFAVKPMQMRRVVLQ
jgi:hypothetical protein